LVPARLVRDGARQLVELPEGYEIPGDRALVRREGNTLVLEPEKEARADRAFDEWAERMRAAAAPDFLEGWEEERQREQRLAPSPADFLDGLDD
jgi:virulence-associated protein VagC